MAALDFGMALARGMLPKAEAAQKDLMDLAGGRNIFKSEDWWNKAVDKQISEGYRQQDRTAKDYLMPTGEYQREQTKTSFQSGRTMNIGGMSWFQPGPTPSLSGYGLPQQGRTVVSFSAPEGAVKQGNQFVTRDIPIFGTSRKDYTAGELSDIESAARKGAEQLKKQTAASKASTKRLSRGTGGLLAKAMLPGQKPVTGMPSLGETGLGIMSTALGKGLEL